MSTTISIRRGLRPADRKPLEALLVATGMFDSEELGAALEFADDRLSHGAESHYRFVVATFNDEICGYACWGKIPGTLKSVQLYWVAVHPEAHSRGVGRSLLAATEAWACEMGRNRIYVETSTKAQDRPTRAFYLMSSYNEAARLPDFFAPGDHKIIYSKVLSEPPVGSE